MSTIRSSPSMPNWVPPALAVLILGSAVCIVYGRAIHTPFIFDDARSVIDNPSIVHLWPLVGDSENPGPLNPSKDHPTSGRPLVNLSLALNYHFGRLDPVGYRVFNMAVHLLSAMLLVAIVGRTLRVAYFQGRFDRVAWPLSFAVALVWALHPLQTESVVYVTQRTELMVGLFYLATLYSSLRYWGASSPRARATWLVVATVACLLGMACKEVMASAPLTAILFERTFIAGSFRRALRQSWALYLGLIFGWALLLILNYDGPRSNSTGFHVGVPAYFWWLTQAKVVLMYLRLTFWPWPLVIHYQIHYIETAAAAWPWLLPAALLALATLLLLQRRAAVGFLGACVFVILSPTLVVPIVSEVAAERRMYLPLAALAALVIVGGYALVQATESFLAPHPNRRSTRWWPIATAAFFTVVLAVALSLVSVRRLAAYHDELTLWQDAAVHQPDDPLVQTAAGVALKKAGRLREAIQHLEQALRIEPHFFQAHYNLARAFEESGRRQQAIEHYQEILRIKPDFAEGHNNIATLLANAGRTQQAIEHYREALRLKPDSAEPHSNLGLILLQAGQTQEAIEHYEDALRLLPDSPAAHNNLGVLLAQAGQTQKAIEHFELVLRLKPSIGAYANLAAAYDQVHRSADAIAAAEKALDLARSQGQTAQAATLEALLTTYRNGASQP